MFRIKIKATTQSYVLITSYYWYLIPTIIHIAPACSLGTSLSWHAFVYVCNRCPENPIMLCSWKKISKPDKCEAEELPAAWQIYAYILAGRLSGQFAGQTVYLSSWQAVSDHELARVANRVDDCSVIEFVWLNGWWVRLKLCISRVNWVFCLLSLSQMGFWIAD